MTDKPDNGLMTFGDHLEVLRRMLLRIMVVVIVLGILLFCLKDEIFTWLIAPASSDFCVYRLLDATCHWVKWDMCLSPFRIHLISTELSAQFMAHLTVSSVLALLLASPYILFELFHFIAPALYVQERRMGIRLVCAVYLLFTLGLAMSYFVVFPVCLRFLGTYQVSSSVENQITISSYVSSFTTLTLMMGLIFQIPVVVYFLARFGFIQSSLMCRFRRHAIIIIFIVAAIITPPDVFSQCLVALPICGLYEISILIAMREERRRLRGNDR